MKKTLIAMSLSLGFVGAASAGGDYMKEYNNYVDRLGDPTPMSYEAWMETNGYAKVSNTPKQALTKKEREYLDYSSSFGDATPPSYAAWENGDPVSDAPRKVITKLESEYLAYTSQFGDATPPSFAQWKSEQRYYDTQLAENKN